MSLLKGASLELAVAGIGTIDQSADAGRDTTRIERQRKCTNRIANVHRLGGKPTANEISITEGSVGDALARPLATSVLAVLVGVMTVLLLLVAPLVTITVVLGLQYRGGIVFLLADVVSPLSFLIAVFVLDLDFIIIVVVLICCRIGGGACDERSDPVVGHLERSFVPHEPGTSMVLLPTT